MSDLILRYPTVDLFTYTLQDGLGQSQEEITAQRQQIWQSILNDQLTDSFLADLKTREAAISNYIELLPDRRISFQVDLCDGNYYPVKLGDTVGIKVSCTPISQQAGADPELCDRGQLYTLKEIVLNHAQGIPGNIGKSWFIWGQLTTAEQDPQAIACDIADTLEFLPVPAARWKWNSAQCGRYRGAYCFSIETGDAIADGINQNRYVWICLFPAEQQKSDIQTTLGQLQRHLMRLFHCRNKIFWAYEQGFQLRNQLKDATYQVQKITQALPKRIAPSQIQLHALQQDLADALTITYNCQTKLNFLTEQAATIQSNLVNYRKRLQAMMNDADEDSDLAFLQEFIDFTEDRFLQQLNTDRENLAISFKPLETFIQTVEGIIDLEKARNDRNLNQTVAFASAGLGLASLTAATFSDQAKDIIAAINPPPADQPPPIANSVWSTALVFGTSIFVGLLGILITWLCLGRNYRQRHQGK